MKLVERIDLEEAASAGMKGMHHLLQLMSSSDDQTNVKSNHIDCTEITEFTVSKFKQVINLLNANLSKPQTSPPPSGHARFRRTPFIPSPSPSETEELNHINHQPQTESVTQGLSSHHSTNPVIVESNPNPCTELVTVPQISSPNDSSPNISMAGDRSVPDTNVDLSIIVAAQPISAAKPLPLSSSRGKRGPRDTHSEDCPCSKTRVQPGVVRTTRVRIGDIADRYSWRKYGQKYIKGAPYPRCSSVKGCPARKRVERDEEDFNILVISYLGDHCHPNA
ncbi:hypothetical protein TanjilG_09409 [Lupinus angustifolius]|uniref:WRKY domain-containing protein n=1 Tax=Lupinus angustifolius TaxID=3871 RepID=A0A4P1RWX4_LUPAN|nr:PREDICTED: probable WRKY transcription factor 17 [Lupinus angustifolius]OIW19389.1 hypothetical protein TanjilG_09409 [Lupinus angustifolius]